MYNVRTICIQYTHVVRTLYVQYTCHHGVYKPKYHWHWHCWWYCRPICVLLCKTVPRKRYKLIYGIPKTAFACPKCKQIQMKRPNIRKPTLETFLEFVLEIKSCINNMHFIIDFNNKIWKEYV